MTEQSGTKEQGVFKKRWSVIARSDLVTGVHFIEVTDGDMAFRCNSQASGLWLYGVLIGEVRIPPLAPITRPARAESIT